MANKKSPRIIGKVSTPYPVNQGLVTAYESIALATTNLNLNDVIQMFVLPAGCVPVAFTIGVTDMDTNASPLLTVNLGLLNAAETAISTAAADGGAAWLTNLVAGTTAAITLSSSTKAIYDILKSVTATTTDRTVAVVVSAAAATAAAGTLTVEMSYKVTN